MLYNDIAIQEVGYQKIANKGKSYTKKDLENTKILVDILAKNAKAKNALLECRKDFNIGQLFESLIKVVLNDYSTGYYSRAHNADYADLRSDIEIKVSVNNKDLATPIKKAARIWFVTAQGVYTISKKTMVEVLNNPYDYMDYVQIKGDSIRLKLNAIQLGKPNTKLNELLGF